MTLSKNDLIKFKQKNDLLKKGKDKIAKVLANSSYFDVNRLLTVMESEFRRCPKLLDCSSESIGGAVMLAARLGLEPDQQLGHFYMIPFKTTLQIIIGYKGLLELALRSPNIKSIYAHEVYDGDKFDVLLGTEKRITHIPNYIDPGPRELIAVYAIAEYTSGVKEIEVMSRHEIDAIRARSKASGSGPWVSDPGAMARKTVLRRICKYIPSAIDAQKAIAAEDSIDTAGNLDQFWEGEVDMDTGEILNIANDSQSSNNVASDLTQKLKNHANVSTGNKS